MTETRAADPTPTPPTPDVAQIQERYAQRVKARLARPTITVTDARDAILDCFVATYFQGVSQGLRGVLDISGGEEQIARLTAGMFRRKLREIGSSFEQPSLDALAEVKDRVDVEMHFGDLPAELKGLHDQVCTLLINKASGALPHRGDRSVVGASAGADDAATGAASDTGNGAARATVMARGTGPQPVVHAETAASARTQQWEAPPRDPGGDVCAGLRGALSAYLHTWAEATRAGEDLASLQVRMQRAARLLETLAEFEG